jgi:glutamate synthase domain-containing protein 1
MFPAGDGAGMLCAMPDSFFSSVLMDEQSFRLPPLGEYAVGQVFLPRDESQRNKGEQAVYCCTMYVVSLTACDVSSTRWARSSW